MSLVFFSNKSVNTKHSCSSSEFMPVSKTRKTELVIASYSHSFPHHFLLFFPVEWRMMVNCGKVDKLVISTWLIFQRRFPYWSKLIHLLAFGLQLSIWWKYLLRSDKQVCHHLEDKQHKSKVTPNLRFWIIPYNRRDLDQGLANFSCRGSDMNILGLYGLCCTLWL